MVRRSVWRQRKKFNQNARNERSGRTENLESLDLVETKQKPNRFAKAILRNAFYVVLYLIFRAYNNQNQTNEDEYKDDDIVQLIKAGNDTSVFVVRKFLPLDLAVKLRGAIHHEWQQETAFKTNESSKNLQSKGIYSNWKFTTMTENSGESYMHVGNKKIRSLDEISSRNNTARDLYNAGESSFAAWELDPSHKLNTKLRDVFMKHNGAQNAIGHLLRWKRHPLSVWEKIASIFLNYRSSDHNVTLSSILDLSVVRFSTGDFIFHKSKEGTCSNEKGNQGTVWNFIIFFTSFTNDEHEESTYKWEPDFGGELRFNCPVSRDIPLQDDLDTQWCNNIQPEFNKAVIFATNYNDECSNMLSYEIMPLGWFPEESHYSHFVVTIKFLENESGS